MHASRLVMSTARASASSAAIPQASGDGFCEPFVDATDDDVGAFRREAITDRRTDTTTAPGDNRNGVPESFHYFPLLFLSRGMR